MRFITTIFIVIAIVYILSKILSPLFLPDSRNPINEEKSQKKTKQNNSFKTNNPKLYFIAKLFGYVLHNKNPYVSTQAYQFIENIFKEDLNVKSNELKSMMRTVKKPNSKPTHIPDGILSDNEKKKVIYNLFYVSLFKPYFFLQTQYFECLYTATKTLYHSYTINKSNFYFNLLKNGEKLKAIAILLKRIATISGPESKAEKSIVLDYISSFKRKNSFKKSEATIIQLMYDAFDSELTNRLSYPAIDFTHFLSIDEREHLLDVMFQIANASEGIVYGELSFLCTYAYFSGISENSFLQFCKKYNKNWSYEYSSKPSPFGYKQHGNSFVSLHENLWENVSKEQTYNSKNSNKQKTYNQSNKQDNKQKKQTYNERDNHQSYEQQKRKTTSLSNTYYALLNLTESVTNEEVKKAYHKMAMKYHPDRLPVDASEYEIKNANEMFIKIQTAYEYICKERNI